MAYSITDESLFRRTFLAVGLAVMVGSLTWASVASARTVESVSVTPTLQVDANAAAVQGSPGSNVPLAISVNNSGSVIGLTGEFGYSGGLFTNSVVKSWYAVIEYQPSGGSWTPLAGIQRVASGYSPASSAPIATGLSAAVVPLARFGVTYPSSGDRVVGTQVAGLNTAQWNLDLRSPQTVAKIIQLLSSSQTSEIRVRTRIESRVTGLFGIQYTDAQTRTATFTKMLRSQSATASDVRVTVTGDGNTQQFSSSNSPALVSLGAGQSVALSASVAMPSVQPKHTGESDGEYLNRLRAAAEQSVTAVTTTSHKAGGVATPYWWWLGENDPGYDLGPVRTINLPASSDTVGVALPIMEIAKQGPATIDAGQTATYDISASNTGDADGNATVTDQVDGEPAATLGGFGQLPTGQNAQGPHSFDIPPNFQSTELHDQASVTWTDAAGGQYGPLTADFTSTVILDTTPPDAPLLTLAPPALTNATEATFEFSGEPSGVFECSVDGAASEDCLSPAVVTDLADGQHAFSVWQVDDADNVGSATTHGWIVDTTPPGAPQLSGVSQNPTNSTSAVVGFTGESGGTFECNVDTVDWQVCSSPIELAGLADGMHTVDVRQTDDAGNTGPPTHGEWVVDTAVPGAPTLDSTPEPLTQNTTAGFGFAGEPGGSFECSLDGEPYASCLNPVSYEDLDEGAHSFRVRQIDDAGNTGDVAEFGWTIDRTPPGTPQVTAAPVALTNQPDATFEFAGEPGGTIECALDGAEFEACNSPASYQGLVDQQHTFSVRQTDEAGNVGSVATHTWTVDATPPAAPTIDSGPPELHSEDVATFEFSGEAGATFECRFDAGGLEPCTSPKVYADLAAGTHSFAVRQTDEAGNASAEASTSFTVQLAVTNAGVEGETLAVTSDPGAVNTIRVSYAGGVYTITDSTSPITAAAGCQSQDSHTVTCNELIAAAIEPGLYAATDDSYLLAMEGGEGESQVTEITIDTGDQDDEVTIDDSVTVQATVEGGDGNDVLTGGPGEDVISGGAGDDQIDSVDSQVDQVFCGEGNDSVRADTMDVLDSCEQVSHPTTVARIEVNPSFPGVEAIEYRAAPGESNDVTVDVGGGAITYSDSSLEVVAGVGCEQVTPQSVSCDITGLNIAYAFLKDGDDRLTADQGGNDLSMGVYGGYGDDTLQGGPGVDGFDGGPGDDDINGGGGEFDSVIYAYIDIDRPYLGPERPEGVNVTLDGAANDGSPSEADNIDDIRWVIGTNHRDVMTAGSADAVFSGFAGDDVLTGGPGVDRLHGNEGDDLLDGGFGADYIDGYEGFDTIDYSSRTQTVYVDWYPDHPADGEEGENDDVRGVEHIIGGSGDDFLGGSSLADVIEGGPGSDTIDAREGDDTVKVRDGELDHVVCGDDTDEVEADPIDNTDATCETVSTPPPDTVIDSAPGEITNNVTAEFTFHAVGEATGFECRIDDEEFFPCTSPKLVEGLLQDTYTFDVRAVRSGIKDPTPAQHEFEVDTTAPDVYITSAPEVQSQDVTASFAFEASEENSTFTCQIDAEVVEPCDGSIAYEGLSQGLHDFKVSATDPAGNTDPVALSYEFSVDQLGPDTVVTTDVVPGSTITYDDPEFVFGVDPLDENAYECKINSRPYVPCEGPWQPQLTDGSYTLSIRATDLAGNSDETPYVLELGVDARPPVSEITGGPRDGSLTNDGQPEFTFVTSSDATAECGVDGEPSFPCASPVQLSLTDGEHTLTVRGVDGSGNVESNPPTQTFTVDTSPPDTTPLFAGTIDRWLQGVPGVYEVFDQRDGVFTGVSSEPPGGFECRVDEVSWRPCYSFITSSGSGFEFLTLTDGEHSLEMRAIDLAGNPDPEPWSQTITVDTSAPDTSAPDTFFGDASPPEGASLDSADLTFELKSNARVDHFECSVDGSRFERCSREFSPLPFDSGQHLVVARAVDDAGNADPTPAERSFTVNPQDPAPSTTIDQAPPTATRERALSVAFHADDEYASFQCRVDDEHWRYCSSPYEARLTDMSPEGEHTVAVRAYDGSRVESPPHSMSFVLDRTAPNAFVTAGLESPLLSSTANVEFDSNELDVTFECSMDGSGPEPCTSPYAASGLSNGTHVFAVRASDAAGNRGRWSVTSFEVDAEIEPAVDLVPPDTALLGTPDGSHFPTANVTFTFETNEIATFECSIDSGDFEPCVSGSAAFTLADGSHHFAVRAVDSSNNVDPTPATADFEVDTVAPIPPAIPGSEEIPPDSWLPSSPSGDFEFPLESPEAVAFRCKLDNAPWRDCDSLVSYPALRDGPHTFLATAIDAAGNESAPFSFSWQFDSSPPQAPVASPVSPGPGSVFLSWTPAFDPASDNGDLPSGLDRYELRVCTRQNWQTCVDLEGAEPGAAVWSNWQTFLPDVLKSDVIGGLTSTDQKQLVVQWQLRAIDHAGNEAPVQNVEWDVPVADPEGESSAELIGGSLLELEDGEFVEDAEDLSLTLAVKDLDFGVRRVGLGCYYGHDDAGHPPCANGQPIDGNDFVPGTGGLTSVVFEEAPGCTEDPEIEGALNCPRHWQPTLTLPPNVFSEGDVPTLWLWVEDATHHITVEYFSGNIPSFAVDATPPPAPEIESQFAQHGVVSVDWNLEGDFSAEDPGIPGSGIDRFTIETRINGGPWSAPITSDADEPWSYDTDVSAVPGDTVDVRVTAFDRVGLSSEPTIASEVMSDGSEVPDDDESTEDEEPELGTAVADLWYWEAPESIEMYGSWSAPDGGVVDRIRITNELHDATIGETPDPAVLTSKSKSCYEVSRCAFTSTVDFMLGTFAVKTVVEVDNGSGLVEIGSTWSDAVPFDALPEENTMDDSDDDPGASNQPLASIAKDKCFKYVDKPFSYDHRVGKRRLYRCRYALKPEFEGKYTVHKPVSSKKIVKDQGGFQAYFKTASGGIGAVLSGRR